MKPPNPEPVNKDTQSNPKLGDTVELQANNLTFIPNEDRKNSEDMHLQETQNSMVLHQIEESEDFSDC